MAAAVRAPAGWRVVCEPQSQEACQRWLAEQWQTLEPFYFAGSAHEPSPSCRRPAGDLDGRAASSLPNARSVAHYTELKGAIDAPLLAKAIAEGMMQADTLRMRFAEDNGEVWQWIDEAMLLPEPSIVRVDSTTPPWR